MQDKNPQPNNLKDNILARIEAEAISPYARWVWLVREYAVWVLWGMSVLFGALSVAVLIFASMHAGYAFYEATHDSALTFFVSVLPYVWVFILLIMSGLAYLNIRATKRGYRYQLAHIVLSSFALSIIGGVFLHAAGIGQSLDNHLGRVMPLYLSQEEKEQRLWQQPEHGRLVGKISTKDTTGEWIVFTDINAGEWVVVTDDLYEQDIHLLERGTLVRVMGLVSSSTPGQIHGCGVLPWMFANDMPLSEVSQEHKAFAERMYAHKDRVKSREAAVQERVYGERAMGRCADMPVVERIRTGKRIEH